MVLPAAPPSPPLHEERGPDQPHPSLSAARLTAVTGLGIAALVGVVPVALAVPEGSIAGNLVYVLELLALACGVVVAVSLMNRRPSRPSRPPAHQITFPPPGAGPMRREPRSLVPAGVATVIAAMMLGATFLLDQASRHAGEADCSRSFDPQTCANDAGLPFAVLGAACAVVFLGATVTALVVGLERLGDRRAARRPPTA